MLISDIHRIRNVILSNWQSCEWLLSEWYFTRIFLTRLVRLPSCLARKGQFHEMLYRHRANYFRWYNISWNWPFRKKHTSGVWQVGSKKFGWNVILVIAIRKIVNSREWHFGFYVCRILAFRDFVTSRFRHLGGLTSSPVPTFRRSDTFRYEMRLKYPNHLKTFNIFFGPRFSQNPSEYGGLTA